MMAMQLASVSQSARSTTAPSAAIVRYAGLPRRVRHQEQVRGFRFGIWSAYLDPASQRELQRRHRIIKHKCTEALSRKLAWDHPFPAYARRWNLKSFMCNTWRASDPRPSKRCINVDELNDPMEGLGPNKSRGIEDVEQSALDKLLDYRTATRLIWSDRSSSWTLVGTESTLTNSFRAMSNARPDLAHRYNKEVNKPSSMASPEEEYDIDPISNRKVFRKNNAKAEPQSQTCIPKEQDIPVKTFKDFKSQFSKYSPPIESKPWQPTHRDGGPSPRPEPISQSRTKSDRDKVGQYQPALHNEPDEELARKLGPVAEGLKKYDNYHEYKPFIYNEPDGKLLENPDPVAQILKKCDDEHEYKPVMYNEPDGKFPGKATPVAQSPKKYGDEHENKPLMYNEPDGKHLEKPVGAKSENHSANTADEAGLRLSKPFTGYSREDSDGYETGQLNQEASSLDINGSSRGWFSSKISTAPLKSQVNRKPDEKSEDLDSLRASDIRAASGIIKGPKEETTAEKEKLRAVLEAEFNQTQHPGENSQSKAETVQDKEIQQIAVAFEIERSYLRNFIAHAKGHIVTARIELAKTSDKTARSSLLKRISFAKERMKARRAQLADIERSGRPSNQVEIENWQSDARRNGVITRPEDLNKLTWNFSRDFPEEFSASWVKKGSSTDDCLVLKGNPNASGSDVAPKDLEGSYQQEVENAAQNAKNGHATRIATEEASPKETSSARMETSLNRSLKITESAQTTEHDPYTKELLGLETPHSEEVPQNDSLASPMSVSSHGYDNRKPIVAEQVKLSEVESTKPPIETEKISDFELVQEIRDIYESAYGPIDNEHRQPVSSSASSSVDTPELSSATSPLPEPTLYKVLAYDPTMQVINTAETTSIVTDTSTALTPAEVLVRLSNPAKFFPHFKPLQVQGYEIVSGSGDVLVFRKVREGIATANAESINSTAPASIPHPQQVVNPIDGMQRFPHPATGNFASPTGFVNHDLPHEDRFISGIDVRREEPVFSGQKSAWRDGQDSSDGFSRRSRRSRKRTILVGAAWVAACSYAVGVVAEYFKTGGSDGSGPVGF